LFLKFRDDRSRTIARQKFLGAALRGGGSFRFRAAMKAGRALKAHARAVPGD